VLELVRLTGATRVHHLTRKGRKVTSSTGKRSAVKVACCVWAGGVRLFTIGGVARKGLA